VEGHGTEFRFQIAGEHEISNAYVSFKRPGWRGFAKLQLRNAGGLDFVATDSSISSRSGRVDYCVSIESGGATVTFPGALTGSPAAWDFTPGELWTMQTDGSEAPLVLLDASRDRNDFVYPHWDRSMKYVVDFRNGSHSEETALAAEISYSHGREIPFGLQLDVSEHVKAVPDGMDHYDRIAIRARSVRDSTCTVGVNLVLSDGRCYAATASLGRHWDASVVPLSAFHAGDALILPDAYPLFLPKKWKSGVSMRESLPDLRLLRKIQIIVDPAWFPERDGRREARFELVSVQLMK
jgi:hypothetical protein